ncbi:hypothetical protein GWN26_14395, partial [Candidatus Saccharibacteria bacterium]|nr:hypothetical protein [Calditrichia bacterium]NIV72161.1 hypothetical protein [Calditrichia bacterium]NIW00237.1 hypothetical protein [Candidatus Saccharibacteria bacterium]NIW80584.1 hypothetical protein [Calditrichia bacterium]
MQGQLFYEEALDEELKEIVRVATEEDLDKLEENRRIEDEALRDCKNRIEDRQLNMNLV